MSSSGQDAVELAALAGLHMLPWQAASLDVMLAERADGKWAAREFGLEVSRQNGKNGVLEGRELAGLFLFPDEQLLIHSAHLFGTSLEAFRRMRELVEGTPELSRRIKRNGIRTANGDESIELAPGPSPDGIGRQPGARLQYKARTKGGAGRGLSGDLLVLDEAMYLPEMVHGPLMPLISARPNPQIAYTGSAVDKNVHLDGKVFSRVRRRALAGDDPSLAYIEYSPAGVTLENAAQFVDDRDVWAEGNPSLGSLITFDAIEAERRSMDQRSFIIERLGVGDWFDEDESATELLITLEQWAQLTDLSSHIAGPVQLAVDATPDLRHAAIGAAGRRPDGLPHVEVPEHRPGMHWVVARVAEIRASHEVAGPVRVDPKSPAAALLPAFRAAGVPVHEISAAEMASSCRLLHAEVVEERLRHLGDDLLAAALRSAARRSLGEAWAWSRRSSQSDISPLVAVTLALGALVDDAAPRGPVVGVIAPSTPPRRARPTPYY